MNSKFSKRVKIAFATIILLSFFGCSKGDPIRRAIKPFQD